jgi:protein-L-isoaspartate(D-aspartate) O-methyltransferase
LPLSAPFDRILVSAASEGGPWERLRQLVVGGIMVIPVGKRNGPQKILKILKRSETDYVTDEYPGYIFVPLVANKL